MRAAGTDLAEFELKDASGGFPKTTVDTISAFANTLGGTIIFGIREKGFHPKGNLDVKSTQDGCAHAARELVNPPMQIDICVLFFEGEPIVVANVPELPVRDGPAT